MEGGTIEAPTTDHYNKFLRRKFIGGQTLPTRYRFPVFRGKKHGSGKLTRAQKVKLCSLMKRLKRQRGKGVVSFVAKHVVPFLRRIPEMLRSKIARKVASTVAASTAATGLNVLAEKLQNRQKPLKTIAKQQGTQSGLDLIDKARQELAKKGQGCRKRRGKGINRSVKGRKRSVIRRRKRKPDVFDR
jgi:hypothetical protein